MDLIDRLGPLEAGKLASCLRIDLDGRGVGCRHLEIAGDAVGAGTTPMTSRRDAAAAVAELALHAVADDTENPESRTGAMLAELCGRHGWPLLLTQLGSLGFQDDTEAARTIASIRAAGATVISNGHIELITCGVQTQPRPRGNTRVRELLEAVAARGTTILLVEQKLDIALAISQRLYVMGHGEIVFEGTPASLAGNAGVRREWLEV